MKITIEHEGIILTLEDENAVTIGEAVQLIRQALIGVGYHPDNVDDYIESEVIL